MAQKRRTYFQYQTSMIKISTIFIFLIFLSLDISIHDAEGRKLNQNIEYDKEERVSNIEEFLEIISELDQNTTIIISKNSNIEISDKISILIDNVNIIGELGDDDEKPEFTFKDIGHIDIRANNILFENIEVKNSEVGPAIRVIEYNETNSDNYASIKFNAVDFKANNETLDTVDFKGGAIFIGKRNYITISDSSFTDNYAQEGGAIYLESPSILEILNCEFMGNTAEIAGGAIYTLPARSSELTDDDESKLEISNSIFENNAYISALADISKVGCIDTDTLASVEFTQVYEFSDCPSKGGGAIFLEELDSVSISYCNFTSNQGVIAAGALFLNENRDISIEYCNFNDNIVDSSSLEDFDFSYGGAIYLVDTQTDSNFYMTFCDFNNNRAEDGGALHFLATKGEVFSFSHVNFNGNTAMNTGGAVVIRNKNFYIGGSNFIGNYAHLGGAMLIANAADLRMLEEINVEVLKVVSPTFEYNVALEGGALALIGAGNVYMNLVNLNHNTAARYGGAIYALESLTSSVTNCIACKFHNNVAIKGGAIYSQSTSDLQLSSATDSLDSLVFTENKALAGASIHYSALNSFKNTLAIRYANFTDNTVLKNMEDLNIPEEYDIYNEYLKTDVNALLGYSSVDPCYPGGGGAICLKTHETAITSALDIKIMSSVFERNKAIVGGACLFVTEKQNSSNSENRKFEIENCQFYNNEAEGAGGGLFIFNPVNIIDSNSSDNLIDLRNSSLIFDGNTISNDEGYGNDVASDLSYLNITSDLTLLENVASSEEFSVIVQLHDVYGSHIKTAIEDSEKIVSVRSELDALSGNVDAMARNGICNFNLKLTLLNDTYEIEFFIHDQNEITSKTEVTIRDCYVGEQRIDYICALCDKDFYSFNPQDPCFPCPENAKCEGGSIIIPEDIYWHSTPFSPSISICLYDDACKYENRSKNLLSIRQKYANMTGVDVNIFGDEYKQCNTGYRDVLCASCEEGYAHSESGECVFCEKSRISLLVAILYCVWSFVLMIMTVNSALSTTKEFNVIGDYEKIKVQQNDKRNKKLKKTRGKINLSDDDDDDTLPVTKSVDIEMQGQSSSPFDEHRKNQLYGVSEGLLEEENAINEVNDGTLQKKKTDEVDAEHESSTSAISNQPSNQKTESFQIEHRNSSMQTESINQRDSASYPLPRTVTSMMREKEIVAQVERILAAERLSESIKIAVNFLKMTSVASVIRSEWTKSITTLLSFESSLSAFSGSSSMAPIECYIGENPQDRAFYGLIFRTFYPLMTFLALMFFVSLYYLYCYIKKTKPKIGFCTLITVVAVVSVFFAYDTVTANLMRIVNCVNPDDLVDFGDQTTYGYNYFINHSNATASYWAEDTAIICYEGRHLVITIVLTFFGIIFFTIGMPILLILTLLYFRKNNKLYNKEIVDKFGFFYQSYVEDYVYWEVVILIRKALVQVVIVFAYRLGPNLQQVMLLGIVIISLALQVSCDPLNARVLNIAETLSLLVSFLTFYVGLVFIDDKTTSAAYTALSVLLIFVTTSLLIFFAVIIFNNVNHLLSMILIESGRDDPENFFRRIYAVCHTKLDPHKEKVKNVSKYLKNQLGSQISGFIKQKLLRDSLNNNNVDSTSNHVNNNQE